MQKPLPEPESFWTDLAPTALDDPAFRAAAAGTVYEPVPDWDKDPPEETFPDPWPGL